MRKILLVALAVGGMHTFGLTSPASAQVPPRRPVAVPTSRPTVSPYLNLLRRGQPASLNYYNLVRPEVEFRNSINTLQQDVATNRQSITQLQTQEPSTLPDTGHGFQYLNHGRFFMNNGSQAGGGTSGFAAANRPATPRPAATSSSAASRPAPRSGASSGSRR